MLSILVFLLVIILLIAEGFIFFVIGYATYVILKKLQEKGWVIKMPDGEDYNPDFRGKK